MFQAIGRTHSLAGWTLVLFGVPISGFGENDAYRWTPLQSDDWEIVEGADGEWAWTENLGRGAVLEITLMATSRSNDALQARKRLDDVSRTGRGPAMFKHITGTTRANAADARVMNRPEIAAARRIGERVWRIGSGYWDVFAGGALT